MNKDLTFWSYVQSIDETKGKGFSARQRSPLTIQLTKALMPDYEKKHLRKKLSWRKDGASN
jgi:hypothetical protein